MRDETCICVPILVSDIVSTNYDLFVNMYCCYFIVTFMSTNPVTRSTSLSLYYVRLAIDPPLFSDSETEAQVCRALRDSRGRLTPTLTRTIVKYCPLDFLQMDAVTHRYASWDWGRVSSCWLTHLHSRDAAFSFLSLRKRKCQRPVAKVHESERWISRQVKKGSTIAKLIQIFHQGILLNISCFLSSTGKRDPF